MTGIRSWMGQVTAFWGCGQNRTGLCKSTACHIAGGSVGWRSEPNASPRDGQGIAEYCRTARREPYDHRAGTSVANDQRQFTVSGYDAEVLVLLSSLPA